MGCYDKPAYWATSELGVSQVWLSKKLRNEKKVMTILHGVIGQHHQ
jgi:hypothetical protein